jgi:hypothetical protein
VILKPYRAVSGSVDVRRWGSMPRNEPRWLKVVRIVLDWRFLVGLAALARVLLNRQCSQPREPALAPGFLFDFGIVETGIVVSD